MSRDSSIGNRSINGAEIMHEWKCLEDAIYVLEKNYLELGEAGKELKNAERGYYNQKYLNPLREYLRALHNYVSSVLL